jgi:hypothetical protein
VLLPAALVFAFHVRWVFGHFSQDGYLCDSGWFAFLFEQADPAMRNPRAVVGQACAGVNAPTYLAHHLSPHFWLFGAPFSLLRIAGTKILAYHQGLFFGIVYVAFGLVATLPLLSARNRRVAMLTALSIGTVGNALLQAAAYPHVETAMIGLSALAIASWLRGYRWLFAGCLVWLPLIREDGGLYAALVALACLAVGHDERARAGPRASRLALVAALGILVSALSFIVQATYFPGFEAFSNNFAGDRWNHVTLAFVLERGRATLTNWNIGPVLIGSVALAAFDRRYLTGVILLAPLLIVHMLSVRPEHGQFTLYYALPWVLPVLLWLVVLVRRMETSRAATIEKLLIVSLSLVLTAPVQAIIGTPQHCWLVIEQAFTRPVADLAAMKAFARSARASLARAPERGQHHCASMGIAALIPDDLAPEDVIDPRSPISACRTLLLLRTDMHYIALTKAAGAAGFRRVFQRENAELWMMAGE